MNVRQKAETNTCTTMVHQMDNRHAKSLSVLAGISYGVYEVLSSVSLILLGFPFQKILQQNCSFD